MLFMIGLMQAGQELIKGQMWHVGCSLSRPHLELDTLKVTEWFPNNFVKLNESKCNLMIFVAKRDTEITFKIGEAYIKESRMQTLLGITTDRSFSFKTNVKTLCRQASQKTSRSCPHILLHVHRTIKAVIESIFNLNLTIVHLFGCSVTEL